MPSSQRCPCRPDSRPRKVSEGDTQLNKKIVDRSYQHEAIRRVAEAFSAGRRRALLVMATGTGKTRTTMGLVDLVLQTSWAQKVLFLADRDALVEQALNDGFKTHLPNEPRVRIRSATIDKDKRLSSRWFRFPSLLRRATCLSGRSRI